MLTPYQTGELLPFFRPRERVIGSPSGDALLLGRLVNETEHLAEKMRYGGEQHVVLIGPNGKGKGTRVLIPNLFQTWGSSIVCVDTTGELAAVTAPYRRKLGPVVIINPFGLHTDIPGYEDLRSWGFNPLANLDPTRPSFNAEAALLAEALIPVDPETKEPHWPMSGRALVAAIIMYVVIEARRHSGRRPTMTRVRELLCQASEPRHPHLPPIGLPKLAEDMIAESLRDPHNLYGLKNKAAQFWDYNRETSSIASVARIQTEAFDDRQICDDLRRDGFDFREIKQRPVTVYVVLPPEQVGRHSKWLRLVLTSALQAVMRPSFEGEPKVQFFLDEFFALGELEYISKVWALVRKYGIQFFPILQDLVQLKTLYPKLWESFIGQAGAVLSFAPNDETTAGWLSRRAGETQRSLASRGLSTSTGKTWGGSSGFSPRGGGSSGSNWGGSSGSNESVNWNEIKTAVITPHRLRGLGDGFLLTTLDGHADIIPTFAPSYLNTMKYLEIARKNPYYLHGRHRDHRHYYVH